MNSASGDVTSGRGEKIDELPRRRSVAEPELGAPFLHGFGAIVLGLARPAWNDFRVFGRAARLLYSAS